MNNMEQDFRADVAKDQALQDMANGTAVAELLDTLPDAEAER